MTSTPMGTMAPPQQQGPPTSPGNSWLFGSPSGFHTQDLSTSPSPTPSSFHTTYPDDHDANRSGQQHLHPHHQFQQPHQPHMQHAQHSHQQQQQQQLAFHHGGTNDHLISFDTSTLLPPTSLNKMSSPGKENVLIVIVISKESVKLVWVSSFTFHSVTKNVQFYNHMSIINLSFNLFFYKTIHNL